MKIKSADDSGVDHRGDHLHRQLAHYVAQRHRLDLGLEDIVWMQGRRLLGDRRTPVHRQPRLRRWSQLWVGSGWLLVASCVAAAAAASCVCWSELTACASASPKPLRSGRSARPRAEAGRRAKAADRGDLGTVAERRQRVDWQRAQDLRTSRVVVNMFLAVCIAVTSDSYVLDWSIRLTISVTGFTFGIST